MIRSQDYEHRTPAAAGVFCFYGMDTGIFALFESKRSVFGINFGKVSLQSLRICIYENLRLLWDPSYNAWIDEL